MYTREMGKEFFFPIAIYYSKRLLYYEYTLSSLLHCTTPDPASANKSVLCRGLW